jgi:hypothetical protein
METNKIPHTVKIFSLTDYTDVHRCSSLRLCVFAREIFQAICYFLSQITLMYTDVLLCASASLRERFFRPFAIFSHRLH